MEGAYLPGNIRQRMQELMKEHKITQAQLATRIGSTESAISRFVSGKTDKISTEHLLRIAKVFEVSTDFLLGEVNTPDRTNFDIEELGLSVQAARNLYTGKANAEIVNRLLESPRFAEVTYMIEQYFDDTLAAGFAGQNQMLTTLSAMLRRNVKTDAAVQAARTVNRQKVPVYQADLTMIQNTFMAALREVKKEIGNDFTAAQTSGKGGAAPWRRTSNRVRPTSPSGLMARVSMKPCFVMIFSADTKSSTQTGLFSRLMAA